MIKFFMPLAILLSMGCAKSATETPVTGNPEPGDQTSTAEEPGTPEEIEVTAEEQDSIGVARLDENGNLILQLRAEGPDGVVGDSMFQFPPTHKKYQYWIDRVGGLEPGESKPVPASQ